VEDSVARFLLHGITTPPLQNPPAEWYHTNLPVIKAMRRTQRIRELRVEESAAAERIAAEVARAGGAQRPRRGLLTLKWSLLPRMRTPTLSKEPPRGRNLSRPLPDLLPRPMWRCLPLTRHRLALAVVRRHLLPAVRKRSRRPEAPLLPKSKRAPRSLRPLLLVLRRGPPRPRLPAAGVLPLSLDRVVAAVAGVPPPPFPGRGPPLPRVSGAARVPPLRKRVAVAVGGGLPPSRPPAGRLPRSPAPAAAAPGVGWQSRRSRACA